MKMAVSQPPALEELRAQASLLSVALREKLSSHSRLPGLQLHSTLTRPVTEHFYLRHTTPFGVSKPSRFRRHTPMLPLLGEEGGSPRICHLLGPGSKSSGPTVLLITVYGHPKLRSHSSTQSLQRASPLSYLRALPNSGTPSLSVTLRVLRPHCPSEGSTPASPPECLSGCP